MKTYSTDDELEAAMTIDLVMTGEDLTVFVWSVLEEFKDQLDQRFTDLNDNWKIDT